MTFSMNKIPKGGKIIINKKESLLNRVQKLKQNKDCNFKDRTSEVHTI